MLRPYFEDFDQSYYANKKAAQCPQAVEELRQERQRCIAHWEAGDDEPDLNDILVYQRILSLELQLETRFATFLRDSKRHARRCIDSHSRILAG